MLFNKINNWLKKYKPYFFGYSNGFFQLSYLSNSPELILASSKKFPFQKVNEERQLIYTDNPFIKGEFHYDELEKGLWAFNSKMTYKNNVSYHPIYDASLPSNYYCLTLNVVENNHKTSFYQFNNIKIPNYSISFLKPKRDFINCHFKGATENQYIFYFDNNWFTNNIKNGKNTSSNFLKVMEDDAIGFANYAISYKQFQDIIENFEKGFSGNKPDRFALKKQTYLFFERFSTVFDELISISSQEINYKDRIIIEKIEKHLLENLYSKFMGIEFLSEKFKMSPTKLKKEFKAVFGTSVLQYFQTKQMELAQQIIQKDNLLIKDVAKLFQYENVSKFSKKFEDVNQKLPSKVK